MTLGNLYRGCIPESERKHHEPMLSARDICSRYGITDRELKIYIKYGGFPEPKEKAIKLYGAIGWDLWPESEVADFFVKEI